MTHSGVFLVVNNGTNILMATHTTPSQQFWYKMWDLGTKTLLDPPFLFFRPYEYEHRVELSIAPSNTTGLLAFSDFTGTVFEDIAAWLYEQKCYWNVRATGIRSFVFSFEDRDEAVAFKLRWG